MAQQEHRSSSVTLPGPLRNAASALQRVPGAAVVGRAAGQALDKVGAVSPRGRRLAVYAGAGVLGVVGAVEWPVAVTGAAVAWLTQPRPQEPQEAEERERAGGVTAAGGEGAWAAVVDEGASTLGAEPVATPSSTPATGTGTAGPGQTDPDPDVLGGGGPLTDEDATTEPTDRTND